MRPETRLHHLIDADDLDEHSQHEGARTAAARTLSETALVVLKVSTDGDITIFRDGTALTTLLGRGPDAGPDA